MIFVVLALLAAAAIHASIIRERQRWPELALVYVLVGACGLPFTFIALRAFLNPETMQHNLQASGNPGIVAGLASFALGLAVIALLTIRLRGAYLTAAVAGWSVFWIGVTYAHILLRAAGGTPLTPLFLFNVVVNHAVVAVLLLALLAIHRRKSGGEKAV